MLVVTTCSKASAQQLTKWQQEADPPHFATTPLNFLDMERNESACEELEKKPRNTDKQVLRSQQLEKHSAAAASSHRETIIS
jgi:hypothetical protein